jgi:hypothetical protein
MKGARMRRIAIFAAAGMAWVAVATATGQSSKLYGLWDFPDALENDVTFKSSLTFAHNVTTNDDEIMKFVRCSTDTKSVEARATTKVKIRDGEYEVADEASDSESNGDLSCESNIHAGTVPYKLPDDGSQVDVTIDGESVLLVRRGE